VTGLYLIHAHPADLFRHYARSPEEHNQTQIQFLTIRVYIDIASLWRKCVDPSKACADALPPKGQPLNWEIDHEHLSDFWITFIYWQTVNGAVGIVGINDDVPDAVLTKVERHWPEICLAPNTWGVRFFGNIVQFICVVRARHIQAAATSGDGLREIETLIGVGMGLERV